MESPSAAAPGHEIVKSPIWKPGGVIGAMIDLERHIIQFIMNGSLLDGQIDTSHWGQTLIYPAISGRGTQKMQIMLNFGESPFVWQTLDKANQIQC